MVDCQTALIQSFQVAYLTAKGLANYVKGDAKPFHDSVQLMQEIRKQISENRIHSFVETGTFRGDSVGWVARHFPNLKCYSCDINPLYFLLARLRFWRLNNLVLFNKKSVDYLREILPHAEPPILFWLDAHWLHDLPLNDEVATILSFCKRPIIFIDDWKGNAFAQTVIDRLALPVLLSDPSLEVKENESEHYCIIQRR